LHKAMLLGKNMKGKAGNLEKFDAPVLEISDNIENSLSGFINEFKP